MSIINNYNIASGIFIQIGAGAGDRDARANYRDGFTEFIKNLPRDRIKKIILVEPNPFNINSLRECWKDYPEAIIHQIAITPNNVNSEYIDFYYSINDGPHYQVSSIIKQHVLNFYANNESLIRNISVPTVNINKFLKEYINIHDEIELLAIDIEGLDAEIMLDIDYKNINIKKISFEYIHMNKKLKDVVENLHANNYIFNGEGLDCSGLDYLFKKIN